MDLPDLAALLADADRLRLVTLVGPQGDAGALVAGLPALAATLLTPRLPAAITFACGGAGAGGRRVCGRVLHLAWRVGFRPTWP
ncbi:MAG: hypothetical protein U0Z44_10675 [Kouleothrix sp.]